MPTAPSKMAYALHDGAQHPGYFWHGPNSYDHQYCQCTAAWLLSIKEASESTPCQRTAVKYSGQAQLPMV